MFLISLIHMLEWDSMLATPHRMNLNARHRLRRVYVHVNRTFYLLVEIVASRHVDVKF